VIGKRGGAAVSSPNPGISAAGEAAGRTALDPSSGPAAIGGMRETEPEPQAPVHPRLHTPAYKRVRSAEEDRLTTVVTDLTRLATAIGSLSFARHPEEDDPSEVHWGRSGDGQYPGARGAPEPVRDGGTTNRTHGLGATGNATPGIAGYASVPDAQTDTHRQAASYYRA
jgi:hypothetical protein